MRDRTRAFTLIELVVVIAILAISALIIYPRIGSPHSDSARLMASAKQLSSVARVTRDMAISTQVPHMLHIDLEQQNYWVTIKSSRVTETRIKDALDLDRHLAEGIRFGRVELVGAGDSFHGPISLTFGPEGEVTPGTLTLISAAGGTVRLIFNESSLSAGPCEIQRVE